MERGFRMRSKWEYPSCVTFVKYLYQCINEDIRYKPKTAGSIGNIKTSLSPIEMKQATVLCPQRHLLFSLTSGNRPWGI